MPQFINVSNYRGESTRAMHARLIFSHMARSASAAD
jgi:hypothetical protein